MIDFVLKNVQSIIIAIIFIVIIEMLLPEGNNKKYIKIVSGIYLIVTILNPFLKLFGKEYDLDFSKNFDSLETSASSNINLKSYYLSSLKDAIKQELCKMGVNIFSIDILFNEDYTEICTVYIKGASQNHEDEIKQFLFENYNIENEKVFFM